jgi:hypothetical protein
VRIHVGDEIVNVGMVVGGMPPVWAHATCPPEIPHGPVCHIERALDGSCDCSDQDRKPLGLRPLRYQERT